MGKFYYKVLRITSDNELCSVAVMLPRELKLIYTPGETTIAKTGGIFIFDTLKNAELFCHFPNKIYKVSAKHIWKPKVIASPWCAGSLVKARNKHKKYTFESITIPQGTLCAKQVTLLEEII